MSTKKKSTEEDDYEEEEILVYADFDTVVDNGIIQKDSKFKLIGLDTDEPFLKIGTQVRGKNIIEIVVLIYVYLLIVYQPYDVLFVFFFNSNMSK